VNKNLIYLGKSHQYHAHMIVNSEQGIRICEVQSFLELHKSLWIHKFWCTCILILMCTFALCLSRKT